MKLYNNRPSPYGRFVLIVAHEKRLIDRLEVRQVDPWSDPPDLLSDVPIGKVPALITDDGTLVTESATIAAYFDALGDGPELVGKDYWPVLARMGLARGVIDAAFAIVIEGRRPLERRWDAWIDRQRRAIARALTRAEIAGDRFDLGDIALACGLAYMDFRLPEIMWRSEHPGLAAWLDRAAERPSMLATTPVSAPG